MKCLNNMCYTLYREIPAVTAWVTLKFAALNLKKRPSTIGWIPLLFSSFSCRYYILFEATSIRCEVASLTE